MCITNIYSFLGLAELSTTCVCSCGVLHTCSVLCWPGSCGRLGGLERYWFATSWEPGRAVGHTGEPGGGEGGEKMRLTLESGLGFELGGTLP